MALVSQPPASLLTLPPELRNEIYQYVFSRKPTSETLPTIPSSINNQPEQPSPLAIALQQSNYTAPHPITYCSNPDLHVLQTCSQIHREATLLALAETTFHLTSNAAYPQHFASLLQPLNFDQQGSLRHITLTAHIKVLRQLNESWCGLPFGHAGLDLETLTIVPKRVEASPTAYAEVADLSQSHTLAYVLAETLKRLRNVRVVQVRNEGCFKGAVFQLVYRGLVYRMWRWGGEKCGLRVECSGENEGEEEWIRVWLGRDEEDCDKGWEVGEEVVRLVGGREQMPSSDVVGAGEGA